MDVFSPILNSFFDERNTLHKSPETQWGISINSPNFKNVKNKLELLQNSIIKNFQSSFVPSWKVKWSIGKGRATADHYLCLLPPSQKTSDGIYVVFCFSREGDGCVLGCATSVSKKKELPEGITERATKHKGDWQLKPSCKINVHDYNNAFFNPLEITVDMVTKEPQGTDALILKHLKESCDLCNQLLNPDSKPVSPEIIHKPKDDVDSTTIVSDFLEKCAEAGLVFSADLAGRFIAALAAKPFVILTGLSGSGKTKIAQAFVRYLAPEQYKLVAVGADWINNEHLLGYANALDPLEYVMPETGVLELILQASTDENSEKPYFLILDEMNLSHVERYFADFLSAMESGEKIQLYSGADRKANGKTVPQSVAWPKNLYIIGTMNVDETTYMFSPKVLDHAQVIEFRVNSDSMAQYLNGTASAIELGKLDGQGTNFATSFHKMAASSASSVTAEDKVQINTILIDVFNKLSNSTAEFGFRTAHEIVCFIANARYLMPDKGLMEIVDFAVMQKLLPKLHGSASALRPILQELVGCCFESVLDENDFPGNNDNARFKVSHKKICRMLEKLESDGFASYPEA